MLLLMRDPDVLVASLIAFDSIIACNNIIACISMTMVDTTCSILSSSVQRQGEDSRKPAY